MNALLMGISQYLNFKHGIDIYSATDEQLLEAGRMHKDNPNTAYLSKTGRSKSNLNARWETSLWKKAQFFASCDPENLYTLLVELKTPQLHSKETETLAAALSQQLPGQWFYWVESGKENGVHMHVLHHSKTPPKSRLQYGSRYFKLNPWKLRHEQYDSPLEAIVRFVAYGGKIKQGGYRGGGQSWEKTWLNEVKEAIACERVKVRLSGSNLPTRGMTTRSPEVEAMWQQVRAQKHQKYLKGLGYEIAV